MKFATAIRKDNEKILGVMTMEWLKKKMHGRYGADQLSIFLLILSILITVISQMSGITLFMIISYILLLAVGYRMFSKDLQKRRMENYKFAMLISPIYSKSKKIQMRINDRKAYRYYRCPNCNTTLRVPKHKGKIQITCTKCKAKFTKKT